MGSVRLREKNSINDKFAFKKTKIIFDFVCETRNLFVNIKELLIRESNYRRDKYAFILNNKTLESNVNNMYLVRVEVAMTSNNQLNERYINTNESRLKNMKLNNHRLYHYIEKKYCDFDVSNTLIINRKNSF